MEEDTDLNEGDSDTESSDVRDEFEALIDEVKSEFYLGCTDYSSLDFIPKLINMKVRHKWTNNSFDELHGFFQSVLPAGNKGPHPFALQSQKDIKEDWFGI